MIVVLAVAIGATLAFGRLMDRVHPVRVLQIAFVVQAVGTVLLLWAFREGLVPFVALAILLGVGLAPGARRRERDSGAAPSTFAAEV